MIAFNGNWKRVNDASISICPHCHWDPREVEYTATISYGPSPDELQVLGELVDFVDQFIDNDDEGKEPKREVIYDWDEAQETRPSWQMILRQVIQRARSPPCKHNMKMSKETRSGEASPCWLPRVLK